MQGQVAALMTPVMACIFSAVFAIFWWRGRPGPHVLAFAASYAVLAIGFLAGELLPITSPYRLLITQFLYSLCLALGSWGLCQRAGRVPPVTALLLIYACAAAVLAGTMIASSEIVPRLIVVNISYGLMATVTAMTLVAAYRRDVTDRLIIALQVLLAANFFLRPVATMLVAADLTAANYRESVYYSIFNLTLSVITLLSAIILVGACLLDQVREIREKAELDLLTGLRTRRGFEQDVVARIEQAKDRGVAVALIVADIDHFKAVNDVWGHQIGDQAIAMFGAIIQGTIRRTDLAGRIGGEEFCILAWDCDGEAALGLAERIRQALHRCQVPGMPANHHLTASLGIAGRLDGEGYGKLFARCDAALYAAKSGGRDRSQLSERPRFAAMPAIAIPETERRRAARS